MMWEVRPVRIALPVPDVVAALAPRLARRPGGVFVVEQWIETGTPTASVETYDAAAVQEQLVRDAVVVDPEDEQQALRFVRKWGLLGEASRDDSVKYYDAVDRTRSTLAKCRRLAKWLAALQEGRWSSPDLPEFGEIERLLPGIPRPVTTSIRRRAHQIALANELNRELFNRRLDVVLIPVKGGIAQQIKPRNLGDLLFIFLAAVLASGRQQLRACDDCGVLFLVSPTNRKRKYCEDNCRVRAGMRRFRARRRKLSADTKSGRARPGRKTP